MSRNYSNFESSDKSIKKEVQSTAPGIEYQFFILFSLASILILAPLAKAEHSFTEVVHFILLPLILVVMYLNYQYLPGFMLHHKGYSTIHNLVAIVYGVICSLFFLMHKLGEHLVESLIPGLGLLIGIVQMAQIFIEPGLYFAPLLVATIGVRDREMTLKWVFWLNLFLGASAVAWILCMVMAVGNGPMRDEELRKETKQRTSWLAYAGTSFLTIVCLWLIGYSASNPSETPSEPHPSSTNEASSFVSQSDSAAKNDANNTPVAESKLLNSWDKYIGQGRMFFQKRKYDRARKEFEHAVTCARKLDSGNRYIVVSLNNVAACYVSTRKFEKAGYCYKEALKIADFADSEIADFKAVGNQYLELLRHQNKDNEAGNLEAQIQSKTNSLENSLGSVSPELIIVEVPPEPEKKTVEPTSVNKEGEQHPTENDQERAVRQAEKRAKLQAYVQGIKIVRLETISGTNGDELVAAMSFPGNPGPYQQSAGSVFENVRIVHVSKVGVTVAIEGEEFLVPAASVEN